MSQPARFPRAAALAAIALCGLAPASSASAQSQPNQSPPAQTQGQPNQNPARPARSREAADPLAEARRTTAVALVSSLADEARGFRDELLRARVQARAADVLWTTDRNRARSLFRRAWEAAEAADLEGQRKLEEARRRTDAEGQRAVAVLRSRPSMRREVLRLAARRERALGEEFLTKLDEARRQESRDAEAASSSSADAAAQTPRIDPDDPPPHMTQRLTLARQLLEDGDTERAVQFADPALYPVNVLAVDFLNRLREKNRPAADERYMSLLTRIAADPVADANSVSLLSSYVFTPYLYLTFGQNGEGHTRRWADNNAPPADLSPQMRAAFLRAAASVLLRQLPPADQDRSSSGRGGAYVVIARMAPLFEQYAPDVAPLLRERLAQLQQDTPAGVRSPDNRALTAGIVPEDPARDPLQEILERIEKATDSAARDEGYVQAAFAALRAKNDSTLARQYADKISDLDLRKQARAFIDFAAAGEAVRAKKAEEAFSLARGGEMSPSHRTWVMTEAARLLSKSDSGRAVEMLEAALAEARRIDAASPDRPRALVAVAAPMFALDRGRAWEMMSEAVKASNAASEFTGEDAQLMVRVQFRRGTSTMNFTAESFDLTGLFSTLAAEDFNRAVELAKGFTGEAPRAAATLAAARVALEEKNVGGQRSEVRGQ